MYGYDCIYCSSRWLLPWAWLKATFNGKNYGLIDIVPMYRLKGIFKKRSPYTVWHVDRDGRVRTDKHRPVVLKAKV